MQTAFARYEAYPDTIKGLTIAYLTIPIELACVATICKPESI